MTDPARDFFQGADAIQRRPITEAQMRDAVEALQRLELYRDAYSDLIAALAAQSGDSPSSIRQVVKARAEGSEKDLIDKLQGTLDLLTGGASLRDYFAAAALTGLLAHERYGSESPSKLADYAYDQADMMLARRCALAACEQQEPVAVCVSVNEWTTEPRYVYPADDKNLPAGTKLYANPLALREPSHEECGLICSAYNSQSGITHMGARMFNAVREVMT